MWFWRGGVRSKHLLEGELEVLQNGGEAWQERGGEKMEEGAKAGLWPSKKLWGLLKILREGAFRNYISSQTDQQRDRQMHMQTHTQTK